MSAQARSSAQSVEAISGNTVRTLSSPAPDAAPPQPRRRTPLVLVPSGGSKRRTPFVVFCFFTLVAALGSVLVLNVSVSSGQYRLVELNDQQVALAQENEMLTQRLKNHEAPQNLAAAAAELGMVASPSFGAIELETGKVSGDPKAAKETDGADALVPAPEVAIAQNSAVESVPSSNMRAPAASEPKPEAIPAEPEAKPVEPKPAEPKPAPKPEPKPAAPEPVDLHGGTIPAPQQQSGN